MGETSPVYSCYSFQQGDMDWVAANQKCFEQKGQLLSVNNYQEEAILTGEMFLGVFMEVGENATEVLTSGINLKEDNWTWFGAGEPMADSIADQLDVSESNATQCQIYSSHPSIRNERRSTEILTTPPPYSPQDIGART